MTETAIFRLACQHSGCKSSLAIEQTNSRDNQNESRAALEARPKGRRRPAGYKPKDLLGMPWEVAFALRAAGWFLRCDIIWHKSNPMPESVTDRPTRAHEYIFLLSKNEQYFYDVDAIREPQATLGERHEGRSGYRDGHPSKESRTANKRALHPLGANKKDVWESEQTAFAGGRHMSIGGIVDVVTPGPKPYKNGNKERKYRSDHGGIAGDDRHQAFGFPWEDTDGMRNKRSVWNVATQPYSAAHFATFPSKLIEPCVLAGSRPGDIVLDPFFGSGTTGMVAEKHGRRWIGFDINPEYAELAKARTAQRSLLGKMVP